MNIITLDCGASFIKGAKFDANTGNIISQMQEAAPSLRDDDDFCNPQNIKRLVLIVTKMVNELRDNEEEIAVGISNEMHGFILAHENGDAYTDYISWQREYGKVNVNGRSGMSVLSQKKHVNNIENTGMKLRAGLPSCNLWYIYNTILASGKTKLVFYTLGDYIIRNVFGIECKCHPTNAAGTGLMNIYTGAWNNELIDEVCLGSVRFPKIGKEIVKCEVDGAVYHVYSAIGDQQAALLGSGLSKEGDLSFNLGTGAQVSILSDNPVRREGLQTRPFFYDKYLLTLPHIPSGRAINVFIRFIKDALSYFDVDADTESVWRTILHLESSVNEYSMKCDLSFFENAITDLTKGSLSNIGEYDLTLPNVVDVVFSQLSSNYLLAAQKVQPQKENVKRIIFSGGIAKKIPQIRDSIINYYNEDYEIAENETMKGLYLAVSEML